MTENEKLEIDLILQAIYQKYYYDFRDYSKSSIRRRVFQRFKRSTYKNLGDMQNDLINNQDFFETLLMDMTINVTEMFRDPHFFKSIRKEIIPKLKNLGEIKIWNAGCSTGEEAYSIAILLKEEEIYNNYRIYSTDINEEVLQIAKKGIFPLSKMRNYTENYIKSGGLSDFSNFYRAKYDNVIMASSLRENILFSCHNLIQDSVFGEMDMILCRNVLIYFNKELQDKVIKLFYDSLKPQGYLCLGTKESIQFSELADSFDQCIPMEKIYRKKST